MCYPTPRGTLSVGRHRGRRQQPTRLTDLVMCVLLTRDENNVFFSHTHTHTHTRTRTTTTFISHGHSQSINIFIFTTQTTTFQHHHRHQQQQQQSWYSYSYAVASEITPFTYPSRELTGLSHPNILSRLQSALILSTNSARLECCSRGCCYGNFWNF